jgi:hypothetical protein
MLELAMCAAVMVTFLAGTFQFGYTFYIYNQLVTAVGNGARYAAQRTYRASSNLDIERGRNAVRNMVVYGDAQPSPDATPQVSHLKPEQVSVEWVLPNGEVAPNGSKPAAVRVAINGYALDAVFKSFSFDGRPAVEYPFVGRFAPSESEQ